MDNIFSATSCLSRADIQQYLAGDLSGDRLHKVESHLLDCPLCAHAMEGFTGMNREDEANLDDVYIAIEERLAKSSAPIPAKKILPWNRIAAAAMILLTIGATFLYYQSSDQRNNYLSYFEGASEASTVRGLNSDLIADDIIPGVRLYEKENYQGSLSFFEDYLANQPSAVANYYAGLSALETGDLGLAVEYLKTARINDEKLYEPATWYLIKSYLDRGDQKAAANLLRDLIKIENGFYSERAKKLLDEIQ